MPETNIVSDQILNSWKEIARYLNRGVRTVQRWESELGLPVRRPRGRRRSAVIAMRSEIDEWLNRCPLEARDQIELSAVAAVRKAEPLVESGKGDRGLSELILNSRALRDDLDRSRKELQDAVKRLMGSLQAYQTLLRELGPKPPENVEVLEIVETTRVA